MSLEDGMSMRAIARQLGIDPHTAHEINSTLDSWDLRGGARAPSKTAFSARVSSTSSRGATADDYHMDRLSVAELWVFEKLVEKVPASEDGPELYHEDVVEVILEAAREGQLPTDVSDIFDSRSLLENPVVDAETIED